MASVGTVRPLPAWFRAFAVALTSAPVPLFAKSTYPPAFARSQEAAATHLRPYVDQPLEFSEYPAAERLVAMPV